LIIYSHFYHSIHTIVRHWNSLLCADAVKNLLTHSLTADWQYNRWWISRYDTVQHI